MRIFSDAIEMVREVERDLFEMGTTYQSKTCQDQDVSDNPDFQTKELCGYAYMLTNFDHEDLVQMAVYSGYLDTPEKLNWLYQESDERLFKLSGASDPANPGTAWRYNEELWGQFIRNGVFSYSYTERWQAQLPYIIRELKERPNTRQAILTMYDRHEDMLNWGGYDRVPCSVSYQFMLREDKLVCIYNQRSCDFVKFFGADVYFTVKLMQFIASRIDKEPGQFIHFLGSLHAFAGDLKDREIF